jgi:hypothetical protein
VFREKATTSEALVQNLEDDVLSLKQCLKQKEQELDDLKQLHSSKLSSMQSELTHEHRDLCDAQRRAEALSAQIQGKDAAAASVAAAHTREMEAQEAQVRAEDACYGQVHVPRLQCILMCFSVQRNGVLEVRRYPSVSIQYLFEVWRRFFGMRHEIGACRDHALHHAYTALEKITFHGNLQASKLTASVRELGEKLASTQAELANTQICAARETCQLQSQLQAASKENGAMKAALESSALALEGASTEQNRLEKDLNCKSVDLERVRISIECMLLSYQACALAMVWAYMHACACIYNPYIYACLCMHICMG